MLSHHKVFSWIAFPYGTSAPTNHSHASGLEGVFTL